MALKKKEIECILLAVPTERILKGLLRQQKRK